MEAIQRLIADWREKSQQAQRNAEIARRVDDGAEGMYHDGIAVTYERCADRLELTAAALAPLAGPVDAQPKATIVGQELVPWTTSGVTDNGPAERVLAGPVDASGEPPTWLPIESAPKDKRVLLYVPDEEGTDYCAQIGYFNDDDPPSAVWMYDANPLRYSHAHPPSHWMPLPSAPSPSAGPPAPTYELVKAGNGRPEGIRCLACGRTSYHPRDVVERYCGACHRFHEGGGPR